MNDAVLIAGVGNVFFGDDAFGVEVVQFLGQEIWPQCVTVRDFGIRGVHLAYELLEPWSLVIVVDALSRGSPPGTVFLVEPRLETGVEATGDAHGMNLSSVLAVAQTLGGTMPPLLIVGCEPACIEARIGLDPVVRAAIPGAIGMIRGIVSRRAPPPGFHRHVDQGRKKGPPQ